MALVRPIAHAENVFVTKFGIPRQGGLARVRTRIVFVPEFRSREALRGIEAYSHLWLIWQFSEVTDADMFRPTVRPPRLGGNKRMGVFATRSPFRPNRLGLSAVHLLEIEETNFGQVLVVEGADLMNGTPIFDIKPYLPFTDSIAGALAPITSVHADYRKHIVCDSSLLCCVPKALQAGLLDVLSEDPRPQYQQDATRIYHLLYDRFEVSFRVELDRIIVLDIQPSSEFSH